MISDVVIVGAGPAGLFTALVGEWLEPGAERPSGPAPGERYPDRIALQGPLHHLLVFAGKPADLESLE